MKAFDWAICWSRKFIFASNFRRFRTLKKSFLNSYRGVHSNVHTFHLILNLQSNFVSISLLSTPNATPLPFLHIVSIGLAWFRYHFHTHCMEICRKHFHFVSFHFVNILYWVLPRFTHFNQFHRNIFWNTFSSIQNGMGQNEIFFIVFLNE